MEQSSPLAALHPTSGLGLFERHHDSHDFCSNFLRPCAWESRGFRAQDYFSRPVRGSSPTTSLAVDLSQNFHIDQRYACLLVVTTLRSYLLSTYPSYSPQMPTPRRALFTSSHLAGYDRRRKQKASVLILTDADCVIHRRHIDASHSLSLLLLLLRSDARRRTNGRLASSTPQATSTTSHHDPSTNFFTNT